MKFPSNLNLVWFVLEVPVKDTDLGTMMSRDLFLFGVT